MKEKEPARLTVLQTAAGAPAGAPEGGGRNRQKTQTQACCNSFACPGSNNTPDKLCICDGNSAFNLSKIDNTGRREYVKLLRKYSKANPGKSLKVSLQLVKEAVGNITSKSTSDKPKVNFMASVASVLGDEVSDKSALDAWLATHNDNDSGFYMLGDISGDGELQFQVVEDTAADANSGDAPPPVDSSDCSYKSANSGDIVSDTASAQRSFASRQLSKLPSSRPRSWSRCRHHFGTRLPAWHHRPRLPRPSPMARQTTSSPIQASIGPRL